MLYILDGCSGTRYSASFSPDGTHILMATGDSTARIIEAATGKEILELTGGYGLVRTALYSPDGKFIVTASHDNISRVWDAVTGKLLLQL